MVLTSLVFAGASIKGLCYAGCVKALEEVNIVENIENYAGTSSGSIVASMCALGYTSGEMVDEIINTDFGDFLQVSIGTFFTGYGIDSGEKLKVWLKSRIKDKTGNELYTFKNLWDDKKKNLVIVTTNVNTHTPLYLSHSSYPDMPIADAIRMSLSIPLVFQSIFFEEQYFVDGGVTDNFPLGIFEPKNTLGIYALTPKEDSKHPFWSINTVEDYIYNIIFCMLDQITRLTNTINYDIINISVDDVSDLDFKMTKEKKHLIINKGYDTTLAYFRDKNPSTPSSRDLTNH